MARRLRGATVYLSGPFGFVGMSSKGEDDKLQPVTRDRYERVLQRFVDGDLFDNLLISRQLDPQGGVVIGHEDYGVGLEISFHSLKEPERLAQFCEKMASAGYIPFEENPWDVGLGLDMECLTLEYRFANDFDLLLEAVDFSLELLQAQKAISSLCMPGAARMAPKGLASRWPRAATSFQKWFDRLGRTAAAAVRRTIDVTYRTNKTDTTITRNLTEEPKRTDA
jgi:hypothetical protein